MLDPEVRKVVARQARKQRELAPSQGGSQTDAQPFVPELADLRTHRIGTRDEPEPDVDQVHYQEETRPTLPAHVIPAAPEQGRSDQAAPNNRRIDPLRQARVANPGIQTVIELAVQIEQRIKAGQDQRHGEDQ